MPTPAEKMAIGFYVVACDHCGQECRYVVQAFHVTGFGLANRFASTRAILINPGSTATPRAEAPIPPVRKKIQPKSRTRKIRKPSRGERWANKLEWSNSDARKWAISFREAGYNARILARLGHEEMYLIGVALQFMAKIVHKKQPAKLPAPFCAFAESAREQFLKICENDK